MGLSVWPAPEDSGVVGPTGATGPQGPKGDKGDTGATGATGATGPAGTAGSQVLTGTTAPAASLGVDGDLYIQDDTRTYLGVTSTTLTHWKKTSGAWVQVGTVGGAKWYLNNTSTSSADTKPGDILLRTDTGDIWQRGATSWGTAVGNLKGPKGDTGETGPAGPTGPAGSVDTVNGKAGPDVTLSASDVGAVANSGGYSRMDGMLHVVYKGTTADAFKVSNADQSAYTAVNKNAQLVTTATATMTDLRIGGSGATFGGGEGGVIAFANAATVPTANPAGALLYAEGGALKVRKSNGAVAEVGSGGAKNTWTPQALGFQAWSVDPAAVANPTTLKAAVVGRTYFAGIYISEPTPVSQVVIFARGWGGSTLIPAARFYAGIYSEAGSRVATSGLVSSLPPAGQQTGTPANAKDNHIGAVPIPLTASTVLQPGRYWAAFLMSAGGSTDFYYMHIQNEAPSNPSNFHLLSPAFMRAGYLSSQSSLPTTITPSSMSLNHDPAIMALA
ncbi:hypothetical protein [Streptomyces sp. NPDC059515]|uniref:hypothetical protein n=1 Tax=Streptomyces sp. NPDC059515 TaxID=3346854 RepID=UPI0036AFF361